MNCAVFFDRDGVINKVMIQDGKPFSPRRFKEFKFVEGVENVLERLKREGFLNIIVTNQPDIARGLMEWKELNKMHEYIKENLPIDDIFVCPHDDKDNCECRKPKPGMFFEAAKKWNINLNASFMIGDSWRDIEAGKAAGCITILVDMPYNQRVDPDYRVEKIEEVLSIISGQ